MKPFLLPLVSLLLVFATQAGAMVGESFANVFVPFTTDGCTRFPDGNPYQDPIKWRHCCVQHDLDYWLGGTAKDRKLSDLRLRRCVAETGEWALAQAMYLAVRIGGAKGLPTPWRWGYGWVVDRGYKPFIRYERDLVEAEMNKLPENLDEIEILPSPIFAVRGSLTGDYCKDVAIEHIASFMDGPFVVAEEDSWTEVRTNGWWKSLELRPLGCREPFVFYFHLLKPHACEEVVNEFSARRRIRLKSVAGPESCETLGTLGR